MCGYNMLSCAKTSIRSRYINNLFQNFAIFGHWTITRVLERSFIQALRAKFEFV